jgi:hypothetical protein
MLTEERIPEKWESRVRKPFGLTIAAFNTVVLPLELHTDEKAAAKELAAKAHDENENEGQDQNQDQNQNQTE